MQQIRKRKIRDPIHNYINLGDLETALMDTPQFQRLRYVRQLALNYLVYPGANHSRFEHSLGVYHLASACARELGLEDYQQRLLSTAALLHDLGHGPFSHLSDAIFKLKGTSHEAFTETLLTLDPVKGILEEHGVVPGDVVSVLRKQHPCFPLISSQLDVDKMDYLVRDAHYTGVASGVDLGRIVNSHRLVDGKVAITATSLPAVESLLISRYLMYPSVYNHRTSRIAERMLLRAYLLKEREGMDQGQEERELGSPGRLEKLQGMIDTEFLRYLMEGEGPGCELAERVFQRRLFKSAFELPFHRVGKEELERIYHRRTKLAEKVEYAISQEFKIPREQIIADFPGLPIKEEAPLMMVSSSGQLKQVSELSKLAAILAHAQYDHWHIRVFVPGEFRELDPLVLERIFSDHIELKDSGSQRFLSEFL